VESASTEGGEGDRGTKRPRRVAKTQMLSKLGFEIDVDGVSTLGGEGDRVAKRPRRYSPIPMSTGLTELDVFPPLIELTELNSPQALSSVIAPFRQMLLDSEERVVAKINATVASMNEILMEGLGEVKSRYVVTVADFLEKWDVDVDGKNFPHAVLRTNFNLEAFKINLETRRGLGQKQCDNILRDVTRFLGCFDFDDDAGDDLSHLMVSIYKQQLLCKVCLSPLYRVKESRLYSLKGSLGHLLDYLENVERTVRAFGGLTTALENIKRSLHWELSPLISEGKASMRGIRAEKDALRIKNWVGSGMCVCCSLGNFTKVVVASVVHCLPPETQLAGFPV
jgi:hypothetical protein